MKKQLKNKLAYAVGLTFLSALQANGGLVQGAYAQEQADRIGRIFVEGNQRIEDATVRSYLLVAPGDPFDPEQLDLSVKTLFNTNLFADVVLDRDGANLIVRVAENPIINRVIFEGNNAISDDNLFEEVQAEARSVFTAARVQADVQRILELYRQSGRFAATVTPQYKPLDQNRVDLIFEIVEGDTTGIRGINFIGNEAFSDRELRSAIVTRQSRWWRFFSSNDNYDPDRLEFDREQLRLFYTNQGYADFRVVSAVADLTPDREDFFVTFAIDEGDLYEFGDVNVETALDKLNEEALRRILPIQQGEVYESDLIEESVEALNFAAGAAGYAFVDVRPRIDRDPATRQANITFAIDEGPRVYVERIDIVNNTTTLDRVIRREMLVAEGDAFNRILLDQSRNRIRALGFFGEVEITETPGTRADRTIVEVSVEEQPTGELAFAAGFSSVDDFLFDISATQRNLLGRGQAMRIRWQESSRTRNIDLRFTEPKFRGLNMSAGVDIFSVRSDFLEEADFRQDSIGGGVRVVFPLTQRSSLGLRYRIVSDDILVDSITPVNFDDDGDGILDDLDGDGVPDIRDFDQCEVANPDPICNQRGEALTSVGGFTFTWDRRNDPIRPSGGFVMSFSQDLAGLGGEVNYLRSEFEGTVYRGLFRNFFDNVIASARLSTGYVFSWGDETIRINDRFFKGGDSFRGFDVAGIGPREFIAFNDATTGEPVIIYENALGGKAYAIASFELAIPLGLPEQFGISGALFTDIGTLGLLDDEDKELIEDNEFQFGVDDSASLRASAGLSVFWDSPFGPIRFDLSHILAREEYDRTETFRFSTRTRF